MSSPIGKKVVEDLTIKTTNKCYQKLNAADLKVDGYVDVHCILTSVVRNGDDRHINMLMHGAPFSEKNSKVQRSKYDLSPIEIEGKIDLENFNFNIEGSRKEKKADVVDFMKEIIKVLNKSYDLNLKRNDILGLLSKDSFENQEKKTFFFLILICPSKMMQLIEIVDKRVEEKSDSRMNYIVFKNVHTWEKKRNSEISKEIKNELSTKKLNSKFKDLSFRKAVNRILEYDNVEEENPKFFWYANKEEEKEEHAKRFVGTESSKTAKSPRGPASPFTPKDKIRKNQFAGLRVQTAPNLTSASPSIPKNAKKNAVPPSSGLRPTVDAFFPAMARGTVHPDEWNIQSEMAKIELEKKKLDIEANLKQKEMDYSHSLKQKEMEMKMKFMNEFLSK